VEERIRAVKADAVRDDYLDCEDLRVQVGATDVRYWDTGGDSPALLLLHGFGGSPEWWGWTIRRLKGKHRIIAPDFPGFGRTEAPADAGYSYHWYAEFVEDFIRAIGLERFVLAGHSMGGAVALLYTLSHSGRVIRLALVSPAYGEKYFPGFHMMVLPFIGEMLAKPPKDERALREGTKILTYRSVEYASETVERYLEFQSQPGYLKGTLRYLRRYCTPFGVTGETRALNRLVERRFPGLGIPVQLVIGAHDAIVAPESGRKLSRVFADCEFHVFEEAGHNPQIEFADEYAELLTMFARG